MNKKCINCKNFSRCTYMFGTPTKICKYYKIK